MLVYLIHNKISHKVYVGQTIQLFKNRKRRHIRDLKNGNHFNQYLQNAWNRYGENNFDFIVLDDCNCLTELNEVEAKYIKLFSGLNICFNLTSGGSNSIPSKESRLKMIESLKKRGTPSDETRKRISDSLKGHVVSVETRKLISRKTKEGMTEEVREKISKSHVGSKRSLESRLNSKISQINRRKREALELFDYSHQVSKRQNTLSGKE